MYFQGFLSSGSMVRYSFASALLYSQQVTLLDHSYGPSCKLLTRSGFVNRQMGRKQRDLINWDMQCVDA